MGIRKPITDLNKFREQFVRWTLRRASFRWPPRGEAMKAAKVDRGLYQCAICKGTFKSKEVKLDHIEPVIPVNPMRELHSVPGNNPTSGLDRFVLRLLCDAGGFQVLCGPCHNVKTQGENSARREAKQQPRTSELHRCEHPDCRGSKE